MDRNKLTIEINNDLPINTEIFKINFGLGESTKYIKHPNDENIIKGIITAIVIEVTNDETKIVKYKSQFKNSQYSFSPKDLNTKVFKSENELRECYNKLR